MKFRNLLIALSLTCIGATAQEYTGQDIIREHRAIWMSPMLGSTWPGRAITEANAASTIKSLETKMKTLKRQGINVIYYHTRAFCDATYASSYEPYASSVAGSRGGTPYFDPFAKVVEIGHAYGIEVYAWVNPYRYSNGGRYGGSELNYENSHPDWLLSSSDQIILNPALPEVRERVAAICSELATNYDIDGLVFDDYFYHSSIGFTADAAQYNAYKAAGGTMTQDYWRRANVDAMVEACRDAVKAARPYAVFAIGPAGKISPANIADYGLTPGPCGDLNWSGLYADPIGWLSKGYLDFLSPQVYWISDFDRLTDWYSVVVPHFKRHLYTSVDCSRLGTGKAAEYLRQIEYMRSHLQNNKSGVVFFDYGAYVNYYEKYDGKSTTWGNILSQTVFPNIALTPVREWDTTWAPVQVTNVRREGNNLVWDAPEGIENQRYCVYCIEDGTAPAQFSHARNTLNGVTYYTTYDISENPDALWGVAVYNRRGAEYGVVFENTPAAAAVTATNLRVSEGPAGLFDFMWDGPVTKYVLELASDAQFNNVLDRAETYTNSCPSSDLPVMEEGSEYFWRVYCLAPNAPATVSASAQVSSQTFNITAPVAGQTGLSDQPVITWNAGGQGCEYTLEISESSSFNNPKFTDVTSEPRYTVPARTLVTGRKYWARVTARRGNAVCTTPVVTFSTVDRSDYQAPELVNPAADGQTMYADQVVTVQDWDGMANVSVEISSTTDFPVRSIYKVTLADFATQTRPLSEIKISTKYLADGQTYYIRTRGAYALTTSSGLVNTAYGPVRSFVYSSEQSGINDVELDTEVYVDADAVLHCGGEFTVYNIAGISVLTASGNTSLAQLPAGVYIIRTLSGNIKWVK